MLSWEFSEISKNTFFTEHLRATASAFSFSEAANGGILWKKVFLKILQNLQENTCGLRNFQEHLSYRTPLQLQLYENGALPTVFGKPQMNTLYI